MEGDQGCGYGSLVTPDPLEAEDRPGRRTRRTLRYIDREEASRIRRQVTLVSSYVRRPFPSKETRRILERDDPGPHVVPGGQGIGLESRESGSVIGRRSGPSCVLPKRLPQGQTESGGIVLAAIAGPRAPRGGVTRKRRCTYRPSVIY